MKLANGLDLMGERDRAEALLRDAMREPPGSGGPEEKAALHYQLGEFARRSGDTAEALRRFSQADELTRGLPGPPQFRAMVLCGRAQVDLALGAMDDAAARLDEALRGAVEARDYPIISHVLAATPSRAASRAPRNAPPSSSAPPTPCAAPATSPWPTPWPSSRPPEPTWARRPSKPPTPGAEPAPSTTSSKTSP
ncbi:tetratricopeptide repeat protein [Actinomadura madurae]|uniref:tetratricopeptide repeat protein n=1 Tax=Actinomadura madurae TaxID=1993 RepID=UPI0020D2565F|nr:tetratricopeptide repeat protein [Actinomadura madurae]MCQ0014714.1 tetratricopeptide repeat protein [Actinomadura madurae]